MAYTGNMKIAWVRPSPRHALAKQVEAAKAWGAERVWGTDPHESVADFVRALRPGDAAGVVTLGRLAASRAAIREVLAAIHGKGVVVHEIGTKRRSDRHGAEMAFDAADELAGDKRTLKRADAKRYGSLGGIAAAAKRAEKRLPVKQARAVWKDLQHYPTVAEAIEHMPDWEPRTAYRTFGKRGSPAGRPKS